MKDEIDVINYNEKWPEMFEHERKHLLKGLPGGLIKRIEHFGSTSVPDLASKPVIDILVEVTSLDDNKPPYYAWFIKRDVYGN